MLISIKLLEVSVFLYFYCTYNYGIVVSYFCMC